MTTDPRHPGDAADLVDLYLDGALEGEALASFERALASDAALAARVEEQRRIDASLGRLFAPEVSPNRRGSFRRWGLPVAAGIAAVAAIGISIALWLTWPTPPEPTRLESVFVAQVAGGFVPAEVCTTDEQFRAWVEDKFEQPLVPASRPPELELLGWSSARLTSSYTGLLLTRVEGREVLATIDRLAFDQYRLDDRQPLDGSLHVFRREVGSLVLYEITPFDRPRVITIMERPEGG